MGVTCKPIGKMSSIMKKLDNQLEADRKSSNENKQGIYEVFSFVEELRHQNSEYYM